MTNFVTTSEITQKLPQTWGMFDSMKFHYTRAEMAYQCIDAGLPLKHYSMSKPSGNAKAC
jgi:hypothetical protein